MSSTYPTERRIATDNPQPALGRDGYEAWLKMMCQFLRRSILLPVIVAAALLIACGSEPQPTSSARPTTEPPAPVTTAVAQAEATVTSALAKSGTAYCGRLCQPEFWLDASVADVEAELNRGAVLGARDRRGFEPMHYAALLADIAVVTALLDRDANIAASSDRGLTPLHVAASGGSGLLSGGHYTMRRYQDPAVVALLLERGADVNAQDQWGTTPLHQVKDPVVAALLLTYGADIDARDDDGRTACQYAIELREAKAIIDLICP